MRIATIQLSVNDSETKNERMNAVNDILNNICSSENPPDLIILPEIWGCGFFDFDNYKNLAEQKNGQTFQMIQSWAVKMNCCILTGSFVEESGGKYFNTSLFIDRKGSILGEYRKIHLFGYESKEQQILTKGDEVTVIDTEFGKVGLSTCYDLRFPEQYRKMADKGVTLFLVVSAWPVARLSHWRLFNQVRALENQCYLVSCNSAGTQCGSEYAGHSMVVSPGGEIVSEAEKDGCVSFCDIDLTLVQSYRNTFPALKDRVEL